MLDLILISILAIVRVIAVTVTVALFGLGLLMYARMNVKLIRKCLSIKVLIGCFMIYSLLALVIGLIPSNY